MYQCSKKKLHSILSQLTVSLEYDSRKSMFTLPNVQDDIHNTQGIEDVDCSVSVAVGPTVNCAPSCGSFPVIDILSAY